MAKGVPTARSQRYKATHKAKESIISIPPTSSNEVISILEKPITQSDGAQCAFSTVRVLDQSLLHAASPGTHPYDLLQVIMASYIFDCSEWYRESEVRNLIANPKYVTLHCNNNLMTQMLSCPNNLMPRMQKFSDCKINPRRVRRPKSFTATKLSKRI